MHNSVAKVRKKSDILKFINDFFLLLIRKGVTLQMIDKRKEECD